MAKKYSTASSTPKRGELDKEEQSSMPLTRPNFMLMAAAGAAIVIGFLLMIGSSTTVDSFDADIFSVRRTVIGPTIAFLGFIFMGFAIMYSPRKKSAGK